MAATSILIIDDDPEFVELTKAILETQQYDVSCAYDAHEGFTKLEERISDVILLDIMMGKGAEGFIFARKIRKDHRFAKIPILMVTSMREQTGFDFPGEPIHPRFFLKRLNDSLPNETLVDCSGAYSTMRAEQPHFQPSLSPLFL